MFFAIIVQSPEYSEAAISLVLPDAEMFIKSWIATAVNTPPTSRLRDADSVYSALTFDEREKNTTTLGEKKRPTKSTHQSRLSATIRYQRSKAEQHEFRTRAACVTSSLRVVFATSV